MSMVAVEHPQVRTARRLEEEISELAGHLAAATCRFLLLIAEFDRLDGWVGHRSCAQWLSWRCGLSPVTAREHVRVGRALEEFAIIREAFAAGRLSYSKARAITRVADHDNEAELVRVALVTTAAQVERIVRGMRRATRAQIVERRWRRTLSWHWDEDGMLSLRARLEPDEGAVVLAALDAARSSEPAQHRTAVPAETREDITARASRDASAEAREAHHTARPDVTTRDECGGPADPSVTLADAFTAIMTSYLGSRSEDATDAEAFQVIVVTNASTLTNETARPSGSHPIAAHDLAAQTSHHGTDADSAVRTPRPAPSSVSASNADDGRPGAVTDQGIALPRDTVLRLACTAAVTPTTISADGTPMDIGRKTRKLTVPLRRALRVRDAGCCRFPGCTARRRLHAHHVRHWAHGGGTTLANLISLCPAHHWTVHEGGHRLHIDDTGRLRVIRPDGSAIDLTPPIGPGDADLITTDDRITPDTVGPGWDGTPLDLDTAVFALLQPSRGDGPVPDGEVRTDALRPGRPPDGEQHEAADRRVA